MSKTIDEAVSVPLIIPDFSITTWLPEHIEKLLEAHLNHTKFVFIIGRLEQQSELDVDSKVRTTAKAIFKFIESVEK